MEKIAGIGGFFFRSKDSEALGKWYEENFGVSMNWRGGEGPTVFVPFSDKSDYFPMTQQFMLNFRVNNMEAMLKQLKANGVKIDEKTMEDRIGKFAWVYDPEGNKIELWEPSEESK